MLLSHTGEGGMTCAIEQHPGRDMRHARDAKDGPAADEMRMRGPARAVPEGNLGSERQRDASCIAQAFRLPRLANRLSEGCSDSRW